MTILTLNRSELEKKIGKITEDVEDKITQMGTPIEEVTASEVSVEVFPNRPDLLSLQNFARAFNQFNKKSRIASFIVKKPEKDFVVTIEKAVKAVRPYTACAIVKGLKLNDERIKEIIDIQEKLHNSIGRHRKKAAIGIYPLDAITLPITFTAKKPQDIVFTPLESKKEMNASQVLKNHPTAEKYTHLLDGYETYPVFVDAAGEVLSLVPLINSEKTGRVTEETKDIFIECSGHNLHYLQKTLNILVAAFSDMGGTIHAMHVKDKSEKDLITPNMQPEKMSFQTSDIEKTLGISLSEKQVRDYLSRMGIGFEKTKKESVALIPSYRTDILHWIDLTEEIAIAHGYENFVAEIPEIATTGEEHALEKAKRTVGSILSGIGLLEASSYHLTTKKNIKKMHFDFKDFIELEDSKTERDVLRMDLLTNLLEIIASNPDSAYPQKIFEVGTIFARDKSGKQETGITESLHLSIALIDDEMRFTDLKQILDYLFKMLNIEYALKEVEDSNYITGRVGAVTYNGKDIGRIGEVAPRVLKNWKIKAPVVALEIDLEEILNK